MCVICILRVLADTVEDFLGRKCMWICVVHFSIAITEVLHQLVYRTVITVCTLLRELIRLRDGYLLLNTGLSRLSDQGRMVAMSGVADQTNFANVPL